MTLSSVANGNRRGTDVRIPVGEVVLDGMLFLPDDTVGLVVFVHGSGSSRRSPRNQFVAEMFHAEGLGTLLFDLLTEEEAEGSEHVFDIPLLASRVVSTIRWLGYENHLAGRALGLFGASTGAAAALVAAAREPDRVRAIVSRGGRPDLAREQLPQVAASTLLIVGEADREVLMLNQQAYKLLRCQKQLITVAGATHLFEEPGTLAEAARAAAVWFVDHLSLSEGTASVIRRGNEQR